MTNIEEQLKTGCDSGDGGKAKNCSAIFLTPCYRRPTRQRPYTFRFNEKTSQRQAVLADLDEMFYI